MLFIRRALNPRDAWSGHVALPGGRQEISDGRDDEKTSMREAEEEVGIDLSRWRRLGRLADDRLIHARGRSMVISIFGFEWDPSAGDASAIILRPQKSEVAVTWWVDTRLLRPEWLGWRQVVASELLGLSTTSLMMRMLRFMHCTHIRFAAIDLPPPTPPPAEAEAGAYQLWGLTLAFISDIRCWLAAACTLLVSFYNIVCVLFATFFHPPLKWLHVRSRIALAIPLVGRGAPPEFEQSFQSDGGPMSQRVLRLGTKNIQVGRLRKGRQDEARSEKRHNRHRKA